MALKSFAGGLVFGERHGTGPPRVVALHGWGRDRHDFHGSLRGLDAVALDLPGFGVSPPPAQVMGAAGYAGALCPMLEELERPQVVVGHSFGGRVATVLAASRAELVVGLVLVGVPLLRPAGRPVRKPSFAYRLARRANRAGLLSDERLERERRRRGSPDYRAATGVMRGVLVEVVAETYEDHLTGLTCPVRMVWGADDREAPVEVAHRAARMVENGDIRVDVVEGCGHHVLLEAPERVRNAVEGLL